jgi:hypothetical protein
MLRDALLWNAIRRRVLIDGVSKRQALRETGMHWKTLEKVLRHESPPEFKRPPRRRPALGHFEHYIEEMLEQDRGLTRKRRRTVRQIHRCLQGYGYQGGYGTVRDYVAAKELPGNEEDEAFLDEILVSPPARRGLYWQPWQRYPPMGSHHAS